MTKIIRQQPLPWELPGTHWIDKQEHSYVDKVIQAHSPFRYYGPDLQHMVDQLEQQFSNYHQVPYALGVNSGTSALHIALAAAGIGPGDEVLLPGYLWVSCISAIVRLGAIPKLVDIDTTFCMDPQDLKNKISEPSKAILYVHMSGTSGDIKAITEIARDNHLFLLEDCAQAAGANFRGKPLGSFGNAAIFSFQLNKNMTSGEGGMILCQDEDFYKRCFAIHDLGYARNDQGRLETSDPNYQLWGVGARMSELTAAFALAQFKKLDAITKSMRDAKNKIKNAIANINAIEVRNIIDTNGDSGPFLITLYPDSDKAEQFTKRLQELGIKGPQGSLACITLKQWGLHWYFNNLSLVNKTALSDDGFPWTHSKNKFASAYSYNKGTLPNCDDYENRGAILAIASNLSEQDCQDIINAFHQAASEIL